MSEGNSFQSLGAMTDKGMADNLLKLKLIDHLIQLTDADCRKCRKICGMVFYWLKQIPIFHL